MLSRDEKDFLRKIPLNKKVVIRPYDENVLVISEKIINQVHSVLPDLEVVHMGASALGLSGQGDVDIYVFSNPADFDKQTILMKSIFGEPKSHKYDSVAWEFERDNHEVQLYLTDSSSAPMKKQIAVYQILKEDENIRKKYEKLKEDMNGKSFKEYQRKKYEFYHQILNKFQRRPKPKCK
jgi:GrpB-like predicted nucleotidyltransferase (UPF0157 family)